MTGLTGARSLALMLTVGLALCSCGTQGPSVSQGQATSAGAEGLSLYQEVDAALHGTVSQRSDAQAVAYARLQGPIVTCMAAAGFAYTPPPFRDAYQGWPDGRALADEDVLAPVDAVTVGRDGFFLAHDFAVGLAEEAARALDENLGYSKLDRVQKENYDAASEKCLPASRSYATNFAPDTDETLADLSGLVSKITATEAVQSALGDYRGCMTSVGVDADSRSDLREPLQAAFSDPSTGLVYRPGTPGWTAAADLERKVAARDAECRSAAHAVAMPLLATQLEVWIREHEDVLTAARGYWADMTQARSTLADAGMAPTDR